MELENSEFKTSELEYSEFEHLEFGNSDIENSEFENLVLKNSEFHWTTNQWNSDEAARDCVGCSAADGLNYTRHLSI